MAKKIGSHRELEVYQLAFEAAMEIFEMTKAFPRKEYDHVLGKLVTMIRQPEKWVIGDRETRGQGEEETR